MFAGKNRTHSSTYSSAAPMTVEPLEARRLLSAASVPFHGTPYVPGQRIEAEDYDLGGPTVAYKDTTAANLGNAGYRTSESVDIVTGGENGKVVGFTAAGEYLHYTINIPKAGAYTIQIRVANPGSGALLHISFDNAKLVLPSIAVPKTKTWDNWRTITTTRANLSAGIHVMRLYFDANSSAHAAGNVDWLKVTPAAGLPDSLWKVAAASPAKRFEGYSRAVNGKLYTFGGYTAVNVFGVNESVDVYDPATNQWTDLGKAPIAETHAGVAVDDAHGWIYFVGGLKGLYNGIATTDVWKYDTNSNSWSQLPSLPVAMAAGGAALVNNQLHYFGGIKADSRYIDYGDHYILNLNDLAGGTARWTTAASMPTPRDHFATETVGGKIYILGGEIGHDLLHEQQYEVDVYDPSTDAWTRLADMPIARSHTESSTFVTTDGKIVMGGGQVDDYQSAASVFEFDPVANTWTALAPLPMALQGTDFVKIGNRLILSMGYDGLSGVASNRTWVGVWSAIAIN
jgi:N-acetylneuraminic acid mutarotase